MTTSKPVARLDDVTKTYRLGSERSNWRALVPGPWGEQVSGQHFNALENVTLEVAAGQSVGIVGVNGAGKSTLLKVLAGVVRPTSGRVSVHGRVAAVIELGVGFDPELTGRENLNFGGSLFGVTARDVASRYDEIVEFAGLEDFMGMPLRRYSTGMRARLGFALVTAFETDVLILDEVLSVGDWAFQQRCIQRVQEFHAAGSAIVAVSHSNWLITQLCDHAVLLEEGRVTFSGTPLAVIDHYLGERTVTDATKDPALPSLPFLAEADAESPVRLADLVVEPEDLPSNERLRFTFRVEVDEPVDAALVMSIYTMGRAVFAEREEGPSDLLRRPGTWIVRGTTAPLPFASGAFQIRVAVVRGHDPDDAHQEHLGALASLNAGFKILGRASTRPGLLIDTEWDASPARS